MDHISFDYDYRKIGDAEYRFCLGEPARDEGKRNLLVIGINPSNYVLGGYTLNTPFAAELLNLVEYIIDKTDCHVLLIPHVFWKGQDDRIVCRALKERFSSSRISILDSEKLTYCQIRHVISKCRMLIAARTHAVISAYATQVPAIALGYSIKSKGIAKAVGMPDWTVVDSRKCKKGALLTAFNRMLEDENGIRSTLQDSIPPYKAQLASLRAYMQTATNTYK